MPQRHDRWLIVRKSGTYWTIMRGRSYRSEGAARRAYQKLKEQWDKAARTGRIHPSWEGKFEQQHVILHVRAGESPKEAWDRSFPNKTPLFTTAH